MALNPAMILPRTALVDRILAARAPLVVLEAPAGMGKSVLLGLIAARSGGAVYVGDAAPAGVRLWDIPAQVRVTRLAADAQPMIIAKRPETELAGLSRAVLYGQAVVFGVEDLALGAEELAGTELLAETGGWPMLLRAPVGRGQDMLCEFLATEVLASLPADELVGLRRTLRAQTPLVLPSLPCLPDVPGFRLALADAVNLSMARRGADRDQAAALARALTGQGLVSEAILTLQACGRMADALQTFATAGAEFYIHVYGPEAFDAVLRGFDGFAPRSEPLLVARVMQALKRGEVPMARRIIADHFGPTGNDPDAVFAPGSAFSLEFRALRLVMLIYEDVHFSETLLRRVYRLLEEFPIDADLLRGSFYNSVLEFYIRNRSFAQGSEVAQRARLHYRRAKVPILLFYISLHQAIMQVMMGNIADARRFAAEAAADLAQVGFDSPGDHRLLALLAGCLDYEGGQPETLTRFLDREFDDFSRGEIWPSLIEFALLYGSQAMAESYSTASARGFLDRLRHNQAHSNTFGQMLDIRDVVLLQNGNRWQEAAKRLADLPGPVNRAFLSQAGEVLVRLEGRDALAHALAWLRQIAYETPTRSGLDNQLAAVLRNQHLNARQRCGVEILQAHVFKAQRNLTAARAALRDTLEMAARSGSLAPLFEERPFLADLIQNKRIRDYLDASPACRQVLRRLQQTATDFAALGQPHGLTRREVRVLAAICEGASNKFIANALGLTESTVKFHLSNVYRKLGVANRKQAMRVAEAAR